MRDSEKNLTHLQRALLFKDSRGPGRMDSMSLGRNWCWIGPYRHPMTARSRVA